MSKEKRSILKSKKTWVAIAVILFVIVLGRYATVTPKENKESQPVSTTQNADDSTKKTTETKETEKSNEVKETFDFSNAEITKENITKAVNSVSESTKLDSVEITNEKGVTIIDIHTTIEDTLSEKTLVKGFANHSVNIYEKLFTNPKVGKVWVWRSTKMIDSKGNEKIEPVLNCALTKENAKDINWTNFKSQVTNDYNALFNIADGKFVHPSIANKLK